MIIISLLAIDKPAVQDIFINSLSMNTCILMQLTYAMNIESDRKSVVKRTYLLSILAGLPFHGGRVQSVNSRLLISEKAVFGITASPSSKPP